jgi:hypothetical protein
MTLMSPILNGGCARSAKTGFLNVEVDILVFIMWFDPQGLVIQRNSSKFGKCLSVIGVRWIFRNPWMPVNSGD